MKHRVIGFAFAASLALAGCGNGTAPEAAQGAAPVAKIQAVLAKPQVLCGRFDQSKQLAGMKKHLLSSGRFCVAARYSCFRLPGDDFPHDKLADLPTLSNPFLDRHRIVDPAV